MTEAAAQQFPWLALRVVCSGVSILDIPQLELKTESEAHQFLVTYGFDLFEASHQEQVWKIYDEACDFIESRLCDARLKFPSQLKDRAAIGDFKKLLLVASGVEVASLSHLNQGQPWVCAILRVMHVMSHMQSDLRLKYLKKIKRQTIDRFEAHIQRVQEGDGEKIYLGFERDRVALVEFQKKESKVRQSVLLKLLHKSQTVAQEIYDHVGVRFITKTRSEALWVIRYLIQHHLISFANVMSARCRNSLINLEEFYSEFKKLSSDSPRESELKSLDKILPFPKINGNENPFSASDYHSIQFTCRPLIRIPVIRRGGMRGEMSFFFPMEIQVSDEISFKQTQTGAANHALYKKKQLDAVRQRVLRGLIS
ncbi:MAG: TIGR04552 family protein [Deltaproteobacteria bacterium]|nr:TIGR04552 family protein [Deltaproteobacteria bacterium]